MRNISPYELKALRLAAAFKHLKTQHKELTWEYLLDEINTTEIEPKFDIALATLKRYFDTGTQGKAPFAKSAAHNVYLKQLRIIKVLNTKLNFGIKTAGTFYKKEQEFEIENGHFVYSMPEEQTPLPGIDEYTMYYWRHDGAVGKGLLAIEKKAGKATLEIIYQPLKPNIKLEGDVTYLQGTITVRLQDHADSLNQPLSQLTWLCYENSSKACYTGLYNTIHRSVPPTPVSGRIILFNNQHISGLHGKFSLDGFAHYYLYHKRFNAPNAGFNFSSGHPARAVTEDKFINSFFDTTKFAGLYKVSFINPKQCTYETAILKISDRAEVEWLVDFNIDTIPFKGIARCYTSKKNLIISYDFKEEIDDYRMTLSLDISNYHNQLNVKLNGLLYGLEVRKEEPIVSVAVAEKISNDNKQITSYKNDIKVFHLWVANGFKAFEKETKQQGTYDFFYGRHNMNFSWLSIINHITNIHSQQ